MSAVNVRWTLQDGRRRSSRFPEDYDWDDVRNEIWRGLGDPRPAPGRVRLFHSDKSVEVHYEEVVQANANVFVVIQPEPPALLSWSGDTSGVIDLNVQRHISLWEDVRVHINQVDFPDRSRPGKSAIRLFRDAANVEEVDYEQAVEKNARVFVVVKRKTPALVYFKFEGELLSGQVDLNVYPHITTWEHLRAHINDHHLSTESRLGVGAIRLFLSDGNEVPYEQQIEKNSRVTLKILRANRTAPSCGSESRVDDATVSDRTYFEMSRFIDRRVMFAREQSYQMLDYPTASKLSTASQPDPSLAENVRTHSSLKPSIRQIPATERYWAAVARYAAGKFRAEQACNVDLTWPTTATNEAKQVRPPFGALFEASLPDLTFEARHDGFEPFHATLTGSKRPDFLVFSQPACDDDGISKREVLVIGEVKPLSYIANGDRGQLLRYLQLAHHFSQRPRLMGVLICPEYAEVYEQLWRDNASAPVMLCVRISLAPHDRLVNWDRLVSLVAIGTVLPGALEGDDAPYVSCGTFSIVTRNGAMARKWFLHQAVGHQQFENEVRVLSVLNQQLPTPSQAMIPQLQPASMDERAFLAWHIDMIPFGRPAKPTDLTIERFCQLIQLLKDVHQAGYVHCDVRQANLIVAGSGDQERLVLVDWAAAGALGAERARWSGTLVTLDTGTLVALDSQEAVTLRPAHDLHSLWHTAYLTWDASFREDLTYLACANDYIGIGAWWRHRLICGPSWMPVEAAAEAADYAGLAAKLQQAMRTEPDTYMLFKGVV